MIDFNLRKNQYANLSILLAEDNNLNRNMMVKILQKMGYNNLVVVNDGKEAIEKYNSFKFDLILLDNKMPNINGLDVCKYIREKDNEQIIIILSADPIEFFSNNEQELINDFCRKPIKMLDIDIILQKWGKKLIKT